MQYLCQVSVYPVGFAADLDGDVAALGDEAVVHGGLLEHGGAASLQRAVRRSGAAYGPVNADVLTGRHSPTIRVFPVSPLGSPVVGNGITACLQLINNLEVNEVVLYARMENVEESTLIRPGARANRVVGLS